MEYLQQFSSAMDSALAASPLAWDHGLILLHAFAEAATALALLLLPLGLLYLALRRRDLGYRGLLVLCASALFALAVVHGFAAWQLWWPDPERGGRLGAIAATLLAVTALAFLAWLPRARRLPSPAQLRRANATLSREAFEQHQELRERRARAALVTQALLQADTALALVSPGGGWSEVNPRFLTLLGVKRMDLESPEALLGKGYAKTEGTRVVERSDEGQSRTLRLNWRSITIEERHFGWLVQGTEVGQEREHVQTLERLRKELGESAEERQRAQAAHQQELAAAKARLEEETEARRQALQQVHSLAEQLMRTSARVNQIDERIGTLARRDPATGLGTPYAFAERLATALAEARRHGQPLGLLLLSPDPVEGLSPPAALVAAAKAVAGTLRETDASGLLDEQHMAVVLPHTAPGQALRVAERFRSVVQEKTAARSPRLSCCIGVGAWRTGQSEEDLIREAGDALRRARSTGRNKVQAAGAGEGSSAK